MMNMNAVLPLSRYPLFASSDPDETQMQVLNSLGPHKLAIRDRAENFHAAQNLVKIAQSTVTYLEYEVAAHVSAAVMERSYLFFALLEGDTKLHVDGQQLELEPGFGAVIVPERPFSLRTSCRASALMWKVSRAALERQARALTGRDFKGIVQFDPLARLQSGKGARLFRTLRFVASELQDETSAATTPFIEETMEQMLIRVLLDAQASQLSESLDYKSSSRIAPRCVLRVERYIAERLGEEITVEAMVQASGVSGRTMFSAFKKFRGRSPMAYLRNLRMQQVRRELLEAEPSVRVTDVLMRHGVTQFGRFAVAYKRFYGESPSQTVKR
jgi:AraC-like DNA-binding protein